MKEMKKTELLGLSVVLMLIAATAACVQEPDYSDAMITYKVYGGFVMPAHAVQELIVTQDKATLTISAADGTITERFEKPLTKEQFIAIVTVFSDNDFDSYGGRYDEGQHYVTDVGFSDITFTANGKTKTVTTYNVNEYLPAGLVRIREKLRDTAEFTRMPDERRIQEIAEDWIRGAPTYLYDGSGLELVNSVRQETDPLRHVLTYRFTSSHAGYGDRSDRATAQVITEHRITITMIDGTVVSAVIDERWDEMGQYMQGSELSLSYRPRKCEKTPWQDWEENSGRVYVRMPTDEEIIRHYYAAMYEIDVRDVRKIQLDQVTCEACGLCPETFMFELTVEAGDMQPLFEEGWSRAE